jgi:signal transduction histidine kinase
MVRNLDKSNGMPSPQDEIADLRARLARAEAALRAIGDLPERRSADDDLRAAREDLERHVADRTTELARAGEVLKAERQRLYTVLDTLPVYVVLLAPDYRVPFANRFFEERFGKSNGMRCYEYLFSRTEACEDCETFKVLKTHSPHNWQWTGPDGRDYDVYDFPFTDSDGSRLIMEMGLDVTERNRAERDLHNRTEQLRALASELTLAEQRERRRLARVLHDDLQQLLVGAKFHLARLSHTPDEGVRKAVAQAEGLIDESIQKSRSLTAELSPPVLHERGLAPALEWLAAWMRERHGLAVELDAADHAPTESEDLAILLFQSVKELLFNVAKHARARTARVTLRRAGDETEMVVSDDGVGFDPSAAEPRAGRPGGFGLFSIRQRLDQLGGRLEIDSAPGRGSRFTIRTPIGSPCAGRGETAGRGLPT